jgi:3-oxoacyl-[acyl-carrier protein] reductase
VELRHTLAVVTGATLGIGRAIAFALGARGCRVAICARRDDRVRATVAALTEAGVDAVGARCDVADPQSVEAFEEFVTAQRGQAQIVVNNAGIARFGPIDTLPLEDWDAVIATNLRSLFLVSRAFLPGLRRAGGGTIVNVASLAARHGSSDGTAYCASKHGALGFSRALMHELRKDNIRVLAVCPGSVDTPLLEHQTLRAVDRARILAPADVAASVVAALELPGRAMVSELDIRPTNP